MIGAVDFIGKQVFRLLSLLVSIPISRATRKLIGYGWTVARPNHPPKNPNNANVGLVDALIWAAIYGTGTALGRLLSAKGAAGTWRAIIGTEPPGSTGQAKPRPR